MPVNLPVTSHGVAPTAAPAPDLSPPGGRPGTPAGGEVDGLASRKVPGTDAVRPMGLGRLPSLPKKVLKYQIADRLPLVDVARLGTVNRVLHKTMGESMAGYVDVAHAALDKVRQMACESLKDQPDALNAAFAARDRLPPHERGGLMTHFAQMLDGAATPEALTHVLDHLFEATQSLASPARAEMAALMAARIGGLPPGVQTGAFNLLTQEVLSKLDKADMLAPLQALAGQITSLPAEQRLGAMGGLALQNQNSLDPQLRGLTLDPPQQAQLLATLSEGIGSLGDGGQLMAFNFLQGMTLRLPTADMLAPLQALAGQIAGLPVEQRLGAMGGLALQNQNNPDPQLHGLTLDPPQQAQLLATLSEGIGSMGDGGQLMAFNFLRSMTLGLPLEHRSTSQEALSQQVRALPADQRAESLWVIGTEIRAGAADPLHADRLVLKVAGTLAMPDEDLAWLLGSIVHRAVESVDLPEGHRATLMGEVRQVVAGAQCRGLRTCGRDWTLPGIDVTRHGTARLLQVILEMRHP